MACCGSEFCHSKSGGACNCKRQGNYCTQHDKRFSDTYLHLCLLLLIFFSLVNVSRAQVAPPGKKTFPAKVQIAKSKVRGENREVFRRLNNQYKGIMLARLGSKSKDLNTQFLATLYQVHKDKPSIFVWLTLIDRVLSNGSPSLSARVILSDSTLNCEGCDVEVLRLDIPLRALRDELSSDRFRYQTQDVAGSTRVFLNLVSP